MLHTGVVSIGTPRELAEKLTSSLEGTEQAIALELERALSSLDALASVLETAGCDPRVVSDAEVLFRALVGTHETVEARVVQSAAAREANDRTAMVRAILAERALVGSQRLLGALRSAYRVLSTNGTHT